MKIFQALMTIYTIAATMANSDVPDCAARCRTKKKNVSV